MLQSGIEEVAADFYEAALDPTLLSRALQRFAGLAGAQGANYLLADPFISSNAVACQFGQPPEATAAYNKEFTSLDPLNMLAKRAAPGVWLNDWQALGPRYGRSDYYNGFMREFDNHAVLACVLAKETTQVAAISVIRAAGCEAFSPDDEKRLNPLLPHLQRATRLFTATSALRARASLAEGALDALSTAVWLMEPSGRILLANAAAQTLTARTSLFSYRSGILQPLVGAAEWRHALLQATRAPTRASWLTVGDPRSGFAITVAPLCAQAAVARGIERPLAMVLARDLSLRQPTDIATALRALYGLTAAEARVAILIAEGRSTHEVASCIGSGQGTVRHQLKAVFGKTGVKRQSELTRLVSVLGAGA